MGEILTKVRDYVKDKFKNENLDNIAPSKGESGNLSIEYSANARASWYRFSSSLFLNCLSRYCKEKIEKGELRNGFKVMFQQKESKVWLHTECFFKVIASLSIRLFFRNLKPQKKLWSRWKVSIHWMKKTKRTYSQSVLQRKVISHFQRR